jgi:hypothetical protein
MNDQNFELMAGLVGKSYATQAADSRKRREKRVRVSDVGIACMSLTEHTAAGQRAMARAAKMSHA